MLFLNSYAKLNLYLEVLNKRADRYHNIKTLFERIDLSDKIIFKSRPDKKIRIICDWPGVPCDSSNLAYRSAKLLQDKFNIEQGVDIKILKRIPVGSGLGGGSSNAAAVLAGLNKLWKLNLTQHKLLNLARIIGSDVAFFIYNRPFAWGSGRGDRIKPLPSLNKLELWHILVVPKIKVSTPFIYKKWDIEPKSFKLTPHLCTHSRINKKTEYFKGAGLTKPKYAVRMLNLALRKKDLSWIGKALFNHLEIITTKLYPQVRCIKEILSLEGLESILMSGSGGAVFGIVSSRKEAVSLQRQLKAKNRSWQVFVVRTA